MRYSSFKKIIILLFVSLYSFSQEKYVKNDHVSIDTRVENEHYIIDYTFKDHREFLHEIDIVFEKDQTDTMIKKFGFPSSLLKNNQNSFEKEDLKQRNEIIKNGLFLIDGGVIQKDKKAIVKYYRETTYQIANYIISYLEINNQDTRQNRIEMAMKFVQDIPYAIPEEGRRIYKNGYITPPEVLIEGYGDCDSKTILFVCIMSFLIDSDDILFVSIPGHIFSAIKDENHVVHVNSIDDHYIPYTQRNYEDNRDGQYIEYNGFKYFVCETAGPGRSNYGQAYQYQSKKTGTEDASFFKGLQDILEYVPVTSMDRPISKIRHCKIETFDLSEIFVFFGDCYHANQMEYVKDRKNLVFKYHSCYMFNPPNIYDVTQPVN